MEISKEQCVALTFWGGFYYHVETGTVWSNRKGWNKIKLNKAGYYAYTVNGDVCGKITPEFLEGLYGEPAYPETSFLESNRIYVEDEKAEYVAYVIDNDFSQKVDLNGRIALTPPNAGDHGQAIVWGNKTGEDDGWARYSVQQIVPGKLNSGKIDTTIDGRRFRPSVMSLIEYVSGSNSSISEYFS